MRKHNERSQLFWTTIIALVLLPSLLTVFYFATQWAESLWTTLANFVGATSVEFLGTAMALLLAYLAYSMGFRSLQELDEDERRTQLPESMAESQKQYRQLRLDLSIGGAFLCRFTASQPFV